MLFCRSTSHLLPQLHRLLHRRCHRNLQRWFMFFLSLLHWITPRIPRHRTTSALLLLFILQPLFILNHVWADSIFSRTEPTSLEDMPVTADPDSDSAATTPSSPSSPALSPATPSSSAFPGSDTSISPSSAAAAEDDTVYNRHLEGEYSNRGELILVSLHDNEKIRLRLRCGQRIEVADATIEMKACWRESHEELLADDRALIEVINHNVTSSRSTNQTTSSPSSTTTLGTIKGWLSTRYGNLGEEPLIVDRKYLILLGQCNSPRHASSPSTATAAAISRSHRN